MNRFERRLRLYGGRVPRFVSTEALEAEAEPRARAARLVRGALREGRPVILRHARWSALRWWFEDVAGDLALDEPRLDARLLEPMGLGTGPEAWSRLPDLLGEALGVGVVARAFSPTSRDAFRERAAMVFKRARARPRKALLVLGADVLGYELLQDLCDAWLAADRDMTPGTSPVPVLACRIGGQSLELPNALSLFLPDPSRVESIRLLAELAGPDDPERLARVIDTIGHVPGLIQLAGRAGAPDEPGPLRAAVAPMLREVAQAVEIVSGNADHANRLEALAAGPQPFAQQPDFALLRAGVVSVDGRVGPKRTRLRSPLVAELMGL